MTTTLIITCARCGGFVLAKANQKTRTCPYCGANIVVFKAKRVASAETPYEASELLKELKSKYSQQKMT